MRPFKNESVRDKIERTPAPSQTGTPDGPANLAASDQPTCDYSGASPPTPGAGADAGQAGEAGIPACLVAAFGERYELGEQLGQGGFGFVFRALDRRLNRRVAIKVSQTSSSDPDKLLREARSLAQLRHAGIVAVYDVAVSGQFCFVVSELLPGPSLAEWLDEHRPTPLEAVQIVAAVADALGHAHSQSIVHRDIKPGNIVFADGQRPVLVDFGLALTDMDASAELGVVSGTPAYMSPEQTGGRAHRPDGRTDIYGLAATLYAILCGRPPFRGRNSADVFRQIREDEPQPPRQIRPDLPSELERVCLKGMAKLPGDRYTTATDFAEALRRAVGLLPPAPSPASPVVSARPSAPKTTQRSGPRTERRQITLLQCLCEASKGDDDPMEHVAAFQALCAEAVATHGGVSMQASGSAFLACFGYPIAREDAPRQAVRAALAICQRTTTVPAVAVGTGSAVVTENPPAAPVVVGDVVAVTSALLGKEDSAGVTISDTTFRLVDGYFDCESSGEVRPRGLSPVQVHSVRAERAVRTRIDAADPARLSPLVGRDREVALLKERWELTSEGVQNVILLVADPGLGKSRLVRVLRDHVLHTPEGTLPPADSARTELGGTDVIEWFCSPYHLASPFYPVNDYFDRTYQLSREPDPEQRLDLLISRLRADGVHDAEDLALFASMLSIPVGDRLPALALTPERQRDKTRDAILNWIVTRAEGAPVLFVVEDLHWVDPSTEALLTHFVERGGESRVLAVFTFRPEFDPPWKGKAVQTQVALNRLTRSQVAELVRAQAGDRAIPQAVVDQIAERTDGVPLFVEEFTRLLAERGDSIGADIPTTLHDLLLARLDRMESDKTVVQLGAVIGRTFSHAVMQAASELDESALQVELQKLVGAGLVFMKGSPPRCTYTFKHALIQDATYQSMVKKRRQQFHQTVAEKLEDRFPEIAEKQPELIAHHLTEAGQPARAVGYWLKAGQRAQGAFANAEAYRHLTRGLELLSAVPDGPDKTRTELELQLGLAEVQIQQKGYGADEVGPILDRAKVLAEAVGDPALLFFTLRGRWGWHLLRSELDECIVEAREFRDFVLARCAPEYHFEVGFAMGTSHYYRGEFPPALEFSSYGVRTYLPDLSPPIALRTGHDSGIINQSYWALELWHLGYPDQALVQAHEAVKRAIELRHQFTLTHAHHHVAWLAYLCGLGRAARDAAEASIRIAEEQGFAFWIAESTMVRGAALILDGEVERGIEDVRRGGVYTHAAGATLLDAHYAMFLGDGLLRIGRLDDALATVDTGLAHAEASAVRVLEPELLRLRGEILLAKSAGNRDAAQNCFVRSMDVAKQQSALPARLRAAMSLYRLSRGSADAAESRTRLAGVFDEYTEGFGFPDLVAARALLDE